MWTLIIITFIKPRMILHLLTPETGYQALKVFSVP